MAEQLPPAVVGLALILTAACLVVLVGEAYCQLKGWLKFKLWRAWLRRQAGERKERGR